MSCVLFFNFVLLLFAITLLILGTATSRWLVTDYNPTTNTTGEELTGILSQCKRLYRQDDTDGYFSVNSIMTKMANKNVNVDSYLCFNRLLKWYNPSVNGPELLGKPKSLLSAQ